MGRRLGSAEALAAKRSRRDPLLNRRSPRETNRTIRNSELVDANDEIDERYEYTSTRAGNNEAARQSTHHARARVSPRLAGCRPFEAV